ncbi:zinc finger protein 239 isoform X1 [Sergentomyia squamirostris]
MTAKILSDSEKAIILKYFRLNPELLNQKFPVNYEEMIQELNSVSQETLSTEIWLNSILFWTQSVQKNYRYAKKTRILLSSYEDLELLLSTREGMSNSSDQEESPGNHLPAGSINCRICLTVIDRGESLNIFTSFLDNISLGQLLNTCTEIVPVAEHDELPEMICFNCSKLLRSFYNFKILCESSDRHFRETLANQQASSIKSNPEDAESEVVDVFDDDTVSVYQVDYTYEEDLNEFGNQDRNPENYHVLEVVREVSTEVQQLQTDTPTELNSINEDESAEPGVNKYQNQCEHCGTIFKTIKSLRMHKKVHTGDRPHSCEQCSKSFRTRLALKIHIRSHTDERPYVCETCGKGFKTISSINNHRAIHQEERQFPCPVCPYRASTKANLKIHHRTHTGLKPYTCHLCGLSFLTASNMQKHIRNIHKKLKTHKCEECDRSFFTKESAIKHTVTHSGLKPYACPECSQSYGWYNGLQKHMRIQHRGAIIPKEKTFLEALQKMRSFINTPEKSVMKGILGTSHHYAEFQLNASLISSRVHTAWSQANQQE